MIIPAEDPTIASRRTSSTRHRTARRLASGLRKRENISFITVFEPSRNASFKNIDISLDICKKCSVTRMELFNNSENPVRVFDTFEL